jgi:hypothetical protein
MLKQAKPRLKSRACGPAFPACAPGSRSIRGLAVGHVEDPARAVREIGRVLTPGGTLVIPIFTLSVIGAGSGRFCWWTAASMRLTLHALYTEHVAACSSAGLRIEEVREPRIDFAHKWQGCPALLVIRARREA